MVVNREVPPPKNRSPNRTIVPMIPANCKEIRQICRFSADDLAACIKLVVATVDPRKIVKHM